MTERDDNCIWQGNLISILTFHFQYKSFCYLKRKTFQFNGTVLHAATGVLGIITKELESKGPQAHLIDPVAQGRNSPVLKAIDRYVLGRFHTSCVV